MCKAYYCFPYSQLGTSCVSESLIFVVHVSFSIFATRYELCFWKPHVGEQSEPTWGLNGRMKWTRNGFGFFLIRHVIGRNKTRTGFENHTLSLPRDRLVPRQPRAYKSITATQLRCRLISRLLSCHTFKSITAMQLLHEKYLIVQHNIHSHP